IFDPVMSAGGGSALMKSSLTDAIKTLILPLCKLVTPNIPEANQLAREADTLDAAAIELLDMGAEYVLLTGSHDRTADIHHKLFGNNRLLKTFNYQRLEGEYHGSGCTLAASIAALLAQGEDMTNAVHSALDYTYKTLLNAQRLGMGQLIPDRFFWIK
ncbi:MAG: bifunctional hydroxymethylpyrimidine kinase/phosphomethylpyrimidine kinase, partial [Gammaproteobacteria bacterium]|nr:bifunctional hydroxymethylpyrimidine kinase/phosphomethylpyrimidine kinase [Gammaproteobacteria bacterium]